MAKYIDGRSFDPFWQAYRTQKKNTKKRGIGFDMSFDEWKAILIESGKWLERGRLTGQYVMCRRGDVGDYVIGNVYIATNAETTRTTKRPEYTPELRAKLSLIHKGRPHYKARGVKRGPTPDYVKEKIRLGNLGKKNPNANKHKWTPMITPKGIFDNGAIAAEAFGVTTRTAHNRCQSDTFNDWRYVNG